MALFDSRKITALLFTLVAGFAFFFILSGLPLAIIYAVLWIDKIVIGSFGPIRYVGVEFTTFATVLLGFTHGALFSFLFLMIMLPLMHAAKYIFLPLPMPEWPFFVPSPYNLIDALAAISASFLSGLPFIYAVVVVIILKDIGYAVVERAMLGKPVDFISAITYILFNIVIAANFGDFFLRLMGL